MVKYRPTELDAAFSALGDPTRRAILARLAAGDATVGELAAPFDVSLPAISKHLTVLERAGLIARVKKGRVRRVTLVAGAMKEAGEWIERNYRQFWERQFDALADYLDGDDQPEPPDASGDDQ